MMNSSTSNIIQLTKYMKLNVSSLHNKGSFIQTECVKDEKRSNEFIFLKQQRWMCGLKQYK